jgi:hypothetical protein
MFRLSCSLGASLSVQCNPWRQPSPASGVGQAKPMFKVSRSASVFVGMKLHMADYAWNSRRPGSRRNAITVDAQTRRQAKKRRQANRGALFGSISSADRAPDPVVDLRRWHSQCFRRLPGRLLWRHAQPPLPCRASFRNRFDLRSSVPPTTMTTNRGHDRLFLQSFVPAGAQHHLFCISAPDEWLYRL